MSAFFVPRLRPDPRAFLRPVRLVRGEYARAYSGLPRRAWILFAVNLVNASGAMVFFFLSLYLTREMGLTAAKAGQALSLYGFGSLAGAFAGGWLSDRMGSIRVQKMSLAVTGVLLIALGQVRSVAGILPLLFGMALFAGMLYPANATSMAMVCPPDLQVKGFALNRLANNLGATIGPAVGGMLAVRSYGLLFWADGLTSLAAAAVFALLWKGARDAKNGRDAAGGAGAGAGSGAAAGAKPTGRAEPAGSEQRDAALGEAGGIGRPESGEEEATRAGEMTGPARAVASKRAPMGRSPWRDAPFLLMQVIFFFWSMVFIQVLSTFPIYMRNVYGLAENRIGQLYPVNTILIVLLEMILMEKIRKYPRTRMINVSFLLLGLGLGLMPLGRGFWFGALTVAIWTFGEMLSMPLVTALVSQRADDSNRGRYMGMNSFSFSLAFIAGPAAGLAIYDGLGPDAVWFVCAATCVVITIAFSALRPALAKR
ncbi:MAG TPA: MFS transporter [Candidatus Aminicenantes bacterium]|nr:MFS transporter [Candidatus Aminicenantes bacterium]